MAYDDFKEGCSVIKEYADNLNEETAGKIPTKVSELTNDSNYATESYVNTAIGNIAQPSSLPQTYKKKAVTLAASSWGVENTADWSNGHHYDVLDGNISQWYFPFSAKAGDTVSILQSDNTWKSWTIPAKQNASYFTLIIRSEADGGGAGSNSSIGLQWVPTAENGKQLYFYNNSMPSSFPYLYTQIQWTSANPPKTYQYTDADVKVNSEVRFTLDNTNGKLAGQFGLKKTIDKEAGKLTFTADTLPTSAISGTLEIGDTSTDGTAFVEGITSEGVKANEENTFTAKQTFQDVQINGNLTAKGTTTTVDVKNLDVEQQLITVAKGNTAALTSPAGLKAEKYDGTKDGALVFDASGMAMVGDVVLDANGNIDETQSDLQDLATRAKPSELTDGHLLKWDATNKKIVDGGAISSGGIKTDEENTFTKTQTFNGTESQAGVKTNAIDNENGNRIVYFNGEKQMFGSGEIPTEVRSSEQRLKLERPVSGGSGTEIVEVANLEDTKEPAISSMIWNTIPGIYDSGVGQPLRRVMVWQKSQFAAGETTKEVSFAGNTHIDLSIGEPVAIGDGSVSLYIDQGQSKVTMTRIGTADARTVRWMVIGWQAVT